MAKWKKERQVMFLNSSPRLTYYVEKIVNLALKIEIACSFEMLIST
jgi:hypothetical protein